MSFFKNNIQKKIKNREILDCGPENSGSSMSFGTPGRTILESQASATSWLSATSPHLQGSE